VGVGGSNSHIPMSAISIFSTATGPLIGGGSNSALLNNDYAGPGKAVRSLFSEQVPLNGVPLWPQN
jgi:hypothetical protein